jgi:hypothetical protein
MITATKCRWAFGIGVAALAMVLSFGAAVLPLLQPRPPHSLALDLAFLSVTRTTTRLIRTRITRRIILLRPTILRLPTLHRRRATSHRARMCHQDQSPTRHSPAGRMRRVNTAENTSPAKAPAVGSPNGMALLAEMRAVSGVS